MKLPGCCYGGSGTAEEGRAEEEERGIKKMKHTFASFSRPSASHPLVTLDSWVAKQKPARNICNAEYFCAKGNTHQYWPSPLLGFCVPKATSLLNASRLCISDAYNSGACNQRSTSILG
jgi:hypothetical protein